MKDWKGLIGWITILAINSSYAGDVASPLLNKGLSLFKAVELAIEHSYALKQREFEKEAKEYEYDSYGSLLYPQVGGQVKAAYVGGENVYRNKAGDLLSDYLTSVEASVGMTWRIYDSKVDFQLRGLALELAQQDTKYALSKAALRLAVARAYLDVLRDNDRIRLLAVRRQSIMSNEEMVNKRAKLGMATRVDLANVRADLADIDAQLLAARLASENSKSNFERLVGDKVGVIASNLHAEVKLPVDDLGALQSNLGKTSYELQLLGQAAEAIHMQMLGEKSGRLPKIDIYVDSKLGRALRVPDEVAGISDKSVLNNAIGVRASFAGYQGGAQQAKVGRYANLYHALLSEREALQEQLGHDVLVLHNELVESQGRDLALVKFLTAARLRAQENMNGYQVGVRTINNVLESEAEAIAAEQRLSDHRYRTIVSWLGFHAKVGDLGGRHLQAVAKVLG